MSLADCAQAQDESAAAVWRVRLIRVGHNARIEQRGGFEGILVQEVSPHEPALILSEGWMSVKSRAHLIRPRLEDFEQIAVSSPKVLKDVCQLAANGCHIQCQNAIHDVICARPIG